VLCGELGCAATSVTEEEFFLIKCSEEYMSSEKQYQGNNTARK